MIEASSQSNTLSVFGLFLLISSYIKESWELSLRLQVSTIFVFFVTLIFYCNTRACNLYCIMPSPRVKSFLTRTRLHSAMQGSCATIAALIKRSETLKGRFTLCIRVASQVTERFKTLDLRKLGNIRKISN